MRNLLTVLNQIKNEIPSDQADFIAQIDTLISSVCCAAPEMLGFWWSKTATILADNLGNDAGKFIVWQKKIFNIFMDRTETSIECPSCRVHPHQQPCSLNCQLARTTRSQE